ncbi:polysaccharide deacetylase family protein [Microvirga brassicacearum]|uniref:Chitooligosaccharide deacetylase n=1 Tax=Microvirga brassicacearum TaxID=2580413 RepID=A0A5N3PIA8_9HYPH|nr:polysaccharide deacetylase family protein [Microvirga brassicacearum]KAB0269467.1 polysaccharide deacetylase [Microvirga brassicacearum]
MSNDPGLYDYIPYNRRPRITWPNGAKIAVWVAPNIEFYEFTPPPNPQRTPWARPLPDVLAYSHRDYGNRVGWWRMMEAMDDAGFRGSVSLNVALCDHHPEIIEACAKRDWEFFSHGIYNTRYTYGMSPDQERAIIEDSIETIRKWTGQKLSGWLAPALSNNTWTMDLLAEYGVDYTCDLFHDDQPMPVNVKSGRLISMPYSLEMNDVIVYNTNLYSPRHYGEAIKRQFDQLREEGETSGTVMCIPLHPYLVGQPHRIDPFAEALRYIAQHDDVWLATGREIAEHFYAHSYDPMVKAIEAVRA